MKKMSFLVILFALFYGRAEAQSLRDLFIEMPDTLLPLLTTNDRRDLIDFWDARMSTEVTNRLDGKSRITMLADDFLALRLTHSSSMQIKMLSAEGGDTLLCVINTVGAETSDSRICFYDSRWHSVAASRYFEQPSISDFFLPSDSVADVLDLCDIYLVRLSLAPESDSLRADYTMPAFMTRGDSARVAPQLRPLHYRWTGRRFER